MGVASGIPLLSCIEAEILRHFICTPVMAAIFYLPVIPMSESVHTSPAVMLDPENVRVAFGISLLSCMEAKILRYFTSTSG